MADENFGGELAALDFSKLLGAPMVATINAQAQSAIVTLNFLQSKVFVDQGQVKTLSFTYKKLMPAPDGTTQPVDVQLDAPLLSMAPIPYIRVESLLVDLNVKLHSIQTMKLENNLNVDSSTSSSSWFSPVSFNVKVAEKNTYTHNSTVDREYSMHVQLRAVQDEMPGGLAKVLEIFQQSIDSQSKAAVTPPKP